METSHDNILIRLHRLTSRLDEDIVTEAFVHLINHFKEYEPDSAIQIIRVLTCGIPQIKKSDIKSVEIKTQRWTSAGRPDIQIQTIDHLGFVEVKVDSKFGDRQLERYRSHLNVHQNLTVSLSILTRYSFEDNDHKSDCQIRWFQIINLLSTFSFKNELSNFLLNQFMEFSHYRGLAMDRVDWHLTAGIKALDNLIALLEEAMIAENIPIHAKSPGWAWKGYWLDGKRFFVGIYFSGPNFIYFSTEEVQMLNPNENNYVMGKKNDRGGWENILDMESEDSHFFSRSVESQLMCLQQFIRTSYDYGMSIISI